MRHRGASPLGQGGRLLRGQTACVLGRDDVVRDLAQDPLFPVREEDHAQHPVPGDERAQGVLQPGQVHARGVVFLVPVHADVAEVEDPGAADPVGLLHIGERKGLVGGGRVGDNRRQLLQRPGSLAGLSHGVGQAPDGRLVDEFAEQDVDFTLPAHVRDELRGQERVTSELEEAAGDGNLPDTEQVGEDRGDGALDLVLVAGQVRVAVGTVRAGAPGSAQEFRRRDHDGAAGARRTDGGRGQARRCECCRRRPDEAGPRHRRFPSQCRHLCLDRGDQTRNQRIVFSGSEDVDLAGLHTSGAKRTGRGSRREQAVRTGTGTVSAVDQKQCGAGLGRAQLRYIAELCSALSQGLVEGLCESRVRGDQGVSLVVSAVRCRKRCRRRHETVSPAQRDHRMVRDRRDLSPDQVTEALHGSRGRRHVRVHERPRAVRVLTYPLAERGRTRIDPFLAGHVQHTGGQDDDPGWRVSTGAQRLQLRQFADRREDIATTDIAADVASRRQCVDGTCDVLLAVSRHHANARIAEPLPDRVEQCVLAEHQPGAGAQRRRRRSRRRGPGEGTHRQPAQLARHRGRAAARRVHPAAFTLERIRRQLGAPRRGFHSDIRINGLPRDAHTKAPQLPAGGQDVSLRVTPGEGGRQRGDRAARLCRTRQGGQNAAGSDFEQRPGDVAHSHQTVLEPHGRAQLLSPVSPGSWPAPR